MRRYVLFLCFISTLLPKIVSERSFQHNGLGLYVNETFQNMSARIGENITMPCVFNKKVNCDWKRNTSKINLSSRGINLISDKTTDCSLTIRIINQADFTIWYCCHISKTEKHQSNVCSEIQLTQTIDPLITTIEINHTRIEQISIEEIVPMNPSCVSEYGYPAPSLYWELNGKRYDGEMKITTIGESNYTTTLEWNNSVVCEHMRYFNPSKLQCCVERPGQDDCVFILIKQPSVSPIIMQNGRNVTQGIIYFERNLNVTCTLALSASRTSCGDPNITFNLNWIFDGRHVEGLIENGSNKSKILAFNANLTLNPVFPQKVLECRATHSLNHNYSCSANVILQLNGNLANENLQKDAIVIVSSALSIILIGLIIFFLVKLRGKSNIIFTTMKGSRNPQGVIYNNFIGKEEITLIPKCEPSKEKEEIVYADLQFTENKNTAVKQRQTCNETNYAEIVLTSHK